MRLSSAIAAVTFFGALPGGLAVSYLGFRSGFYPYQAVPFVAVGLFVLVMGGLLALLPRIRGREL